MGEAKPLDIGRLQGVLSVLSNEEKTTKVRLQALLAAEATLRQYADLGAFVLSPDCDSVTAFLTQTWESLPKKLVEITHTANEKQRLIGMQIAGQLISLHSVLSKGQSICSFSMLPALLSAWEGNSALFAAGKAALLTKYADVAYSFTLCLADLIKQSAFTQTLCDLLSTWPPSTQIADVRLVETAGKGKKRPRVHKFDNFDPLLAGAKLEKDESTYDFRYGEALCSCWVNLFAKEIPKPTLLSLLDSFPNAVLTHCADPLVFSDYLLNLFFGADRDLAIASLPSLLILVAQNGLECKQFYPTLYRIYRKEIAKGDCPQEKLRKFIEKALRSPMLPASLPASFIKASFSAALTGNRALCKWTLAFSLVLLKAHPGLSHMLQSSEDRFDQKSGDPFKSEAIQSNLWEAAVLKSHWSRKVRHLSDLFERQTALIPQIDTEEVLAETDSVKRTKVEAGVWESLVD